MKPADALDFAIELVELIMVEIDAMVDNEGTDSVEIKCDAEGYIDGDKEGMETGKSLLNVETLKSWNDDSKDMLLTIKDRGFGAEKEQLGPETGIDTYCDTCIPCPVAESIGIDVSIATIVSARSQCCCSAFTTTTPHRLIASRAASRCRQLRANR
jgi:hypothetical protein